MNRADLPKTGGKHLFKLMSISVKEQCGYSYKAGFLSRKTVDIRAGQFGAVGVGMGIKGCLAVELAPAHDTDALHELGQPQTPAHFAQRPLSELATESPPTGSRCSRRR